MKKLFIKSTNWILAGIMALFGFTSCRFVRNMYAAPYADYTVKGTVVNETTGKPIAGIRLGYSPLEWNEDAFGPKPEYGRNYHTHVISNADGGFTLTDRMFPLQSDNKILPVYIEDIDGEENGLFQPQKIDIDFKDAVKGGKPSEWYNGEFTVTTTIQLVEVEVEVE